MRLETIISVAIRGVPTSVWMASTNIPVAKAMRTEACRRRVSGDASKLRLNMQLSLACRCSFAGVWPGDLKAASINRYRLGPGRAVVQRRTQRARARVVLNACVPGPISASSSTASRISMLVIVRRSLDASAFGNEAG